MRANFEDLSAGIYETQRYLDRFFDNLLFGGNHELRNRYMHVDWRGDEPAAVSTDQVTDQVKALLDALGDDELPAREIMCRLGLSHRPTFRRNYLNPRSTPAWWSEPY